METERRAVELVCNGIPQTVVVRADRLLADALREELALTGTKVGCGTGDCGACTVLLDTRPVSSCLIFAVECAGASVETIEVVSSSPVGRVVVEEFVAAGAVQCGICTPGIVVMSSSLLRECNSPPDRTDVEQALVGNLCRCTGYLPIIDAVVRSGKRISEEMTV